MSVDKERFTDLMKGAGYKSQREFAKHLSGRDGGPMDHASLSRILNGERELLLSEAVEMASHFSVPLEEIVDIFLGKKSKASQKKRFKPSAA